jgi:hypothetical protein
MKKGAGHDLQRTVAYVEGLRKTTKILIQDSRFWPKCEYEIPYMQDRSSTYSNMAVDACLYQKF